MAAWLVLVGITFFIPNGFFMFYGNYIAVVGATVFILIGLVLLIDFAHSWSETCLERWEETDSATWKWILIGSTLGLFVVQIVLTIVQYAFFASSGCGLNQFFISFNLALSVLVTVVSISPNVQEANPRSGLAQSGMVVAYTAYLVTSAIANHDDGPGRGHCNPLQSRAAGARSGMVALGAVFTFLAIAYSTSRAATQSKALVGRGKRPIALADGYGALEQEDGGELTPVRQQPARQDSLRYQALVAAVAAEILLPTSAAASCACACVLSKRAAIVGLPARLTRDGLRAIGTAPALAARPIGAEPAPGPPGKRDASAFLRNGLGRSSSSTYAGTVGALCTEAGVGRGASGGAPVGAPATVPEAEVERPEARTAGLGLARRVGELGWLSIPTCDIPSSIVAIDASLPRGFVACFVGETRPAVVDRVL